MGGGAPLAQTKKAPFRERSASHWEASLVLLAERVRFAYIPQAACARVSAQLRISHGRHSSGPLLSARKRKKLPFGSFFVLLAERVRFELTVRLNVRQISSLVHSTTLPPFLIRSFPHQREAELYQAEPVWQGQILYGCQSFDAARKNE